MLRHLYLILDPKRHEVPGFPLYRQGDFLGLHARQGDDNMLPLISPGMESGSATSAGYTKTRRDANGAVVPLGAHGVSVSPFRLS